MSFINLVRAAVRYKIPVLGSNNLVDIANLPVVGAIGSAIIEQGSNNNGNYVKFADGTMICFAKTNFYVASTDRFINISLNFPATFYGSPAVAGSQYISSISGGQALICGSDTTSFSFEAFPVNGNTSFQSNESTYFQWVATGRWKA